MQFSLIQKERAKMSSITALMGAKSNGLIKVADAGLTGMITLRGDLKSAKLATALKSAVGTKVPALGEVLNSAKGGCAWMSPDELILFTDYANADAVVAKLDKALSGEHMLAVNVSDARTVFNLDGKEIRDVLAKGTPADLSVDVLGLNQMRRSRIGQIAVAFWFTSETSAKLVCFRSVGPHMMTWLTTAASKDARVGYH